jgi:hypothetical protein
VFSSAPCSQTTSTCVLLSKPCLKQPQHVFSSAPCSQTTSTCVLLSTLFSNNLNMCSPQHPVLKQPQHVFFPTNIKNNRLILIFMFYIAAGETIQPELYGGNYSRNLPHLGLISSRM